MTANIIAIKKDLESGFSPNMPNIKGKHKIESANGMSVSRISKVCIYI